MCIRGEQDRRTRAGPCRDDPPHRAGPGFETSVLRLPDFGTQSRREAGGNLEGPERMNLVCGEKIARST